MHMHILSNNTVYIYSMQAGLWRWKRKGIRKAWKISQKCGFKRGG